MDLTVEEVYEEGDTNIYGIFVNICKNDRTQGTFELRKYLGRVKTNHNNPPSAFNH